MDLSTRLSDRCLELCRIPSVTGEEAELCDHLVAWAREIPGEQVVVRHGNSLVIHRPAPEKRRPLIGLAGHLDTVPPHQGDLLPRLEGDKLTGLGSSDMKGGVAVAMSLFEDLDPGSLPFEMVLVLFDREEGPHLESGLRTLLAKVPSLRDIDLAIVMEPTDGIVQIGCLGTLHATLTFRGKSAHSARPWQGKNAVTAAGELLFELDARAPLDVEAGGQVFKEVFTVTMARGGRYPNIVPDEFTLNLNYRFAPGKSLETAKRDVVELVAGRAEVKFTDLSPSGAVPWDNPLFRHLLDVSGRDIAAKQAWTDVARLSEAGIDAVNFGPGLPAQAHQAGEHCTVSGLVSAYEDLRRFLETPPGD